jgi:hypothetical protein
MDTREGLLLNVAAFEHAQRVAKLFTSSTMVPEHFRNNLGNCLIALNYAARTGVDPFMVMQKMYVIHGKPAVETQLQIALFNAGGKFTPLRYRMTGEGDKKSCVAVATEKATGEEIEGPAVSVQMAKDEGWYGKAGSKWKTLPDLMLRYRAAAFFIRLYSPETTLGFMTSEEASDIVHVQDEPEQHENKILIDIVDEPAQIEEKKEKPKRKKADKAEDVAAVEVDTEEDPY